MKKIINGKVYDTEKASFIARADHDNIKDATGDTCKQALYRKKTGEFFVHLEGTSITLHNIFQHDYRQGCGIYPLTYDQAAKWAENELEAEKWTEIFGDPEEDSEDVTLCIRVSAAAAAKLKREAAKNGITQSAQLESWIMDA